MKAVLTGETDELVGVNLLDNNSVEHILDVKKANGEITAHQQDGYPDDPDRRSMIDEVEPINQAARYAQYYVNREREYDTVGWRQEPDRILAAALTVARLDSGAIEEYFSDLHDQVRSHSMDIDRPVTVPVECRPGHVSYQQDICLGLDSAAVASLAEQVAQCDEIGVSGETDSTTGAVAAALREIPDDETALPDSSDLTIGTVSGVHVRWDDVNGRYHHERHEQPDLDRQPDARIDVLPFIPDSIAEFQSQLVRNLVCQVRDCYIEMGVTPPDPFRIQGLGKHKTSTWYEHYDFYQRYHDPSAEIEWDAIEPVEHRGR
mgnify:CR=1 FL=1